jgi:hypothetical protein
MLQRFRTARLGRAALLFASVFAVAGSFGLHPEPANNLGAPLPAGSAPAWTVSIDSGNQTDPCTACLAHRFVSLTRLAVFSPAGTAAIPLTPLAQAAPRSLSAPRFIDGRAPPSAS